MITKKRLFLGAALRSLMVLSGMTVALAHGGDAALIHACVNNSSGTIKIVGPNDTLKKNWCPTRLRRQPATSLAVDDKGRGLECASRLHKSIWGGPG